MTQNDNQTRPLDVRLRSTEGLKEVEAFTHEQFLRHAGAKMHLQRLKQLYDTTLVEATQQNQLTDAGRQIALIKLTEAKTINKIIGYLNENNYPQ